MRDWRTGLSAICLTMLTISQGMAGEWPQILGPSRNGIAVSEKIPATAMKVAWQVRCGAGLAGVAVSDEIAVLFHRQGDEETLTAWKAANGTFLWEAKFPCTYQAQIVDDDGPRAVPTIDGGQIFAYGVQGGLYAVDLKTGKVLWTRATHKDYSAPEGYFGAGSSPLVIGNLVVVNVGGPKQAGVVAFDRQTGKTIWKSTNELASYSAPIRIEREGKSRVIVLTRLNLVGLDATDGAELFRIPFGSRGPTVNAALPVAVGNQLLLTASYGIGARLIEITASSAEETWDDTILSSQYTTPIVHDGTVYGIDGRQDGGPITLKCFDPSTRKELWSEPLSDYATLIAADSKLLIQLTNGGLQIAALDHTRYRELHTQKLASGTTRALPALSNGYYFLRSADKLLAYRWE